MKWWSWIVTPLFIEKLKCAHRGHDYINMCPPSVTPFVVCRRCHHGGWML